MNDDLTPDPIDRDVGARLRDARRAQALSQESLGQRLNLTAHEVQRLEKGLDRLSAVMLVRAAEAIGVRPAALLPELPQTSCFPASNGFAADAEPSHESELLKAFARIGSRDLKSTIVNMARRLADESAMDAAGCISDGDGDDPRGSSQSRDVGRDTA